MSGMVAILNLDGAPVERPLLRQMTDFMAFRGPDAQAVWLDGSIGFGHTMLRTTWEAEYEHQPFTLDQQVWIVADARIDDRETLAAKLDLPPLATYPFQESGNRIITDVEFILRAYLKWGEECVHHLLGDFVFVIWDQRQQRLFCARDQFGIKLFYYSRVGNSLLISNTLNCLRQHPKVSNQLNEAAIGDFLLFDMNYNLETTTFADIQRLPPAHTLTFSNGTLKTERYWTLPLPDLIRYKRSQDYIDHFHEVMNQAVGDRLRTEKVSIFFSGGLDSTAIAAKALDVAKKRSQPLDLQAFTVVYDHLIPDKERYYSGIAAKALGIPVHYLAADDYELYEGWERSEFRPPEPNHYPFSIITTNQLRQITTHGRVALYGQGGDEALKGSTLVELVRCMHIDELLSDVRLSIWQHHLIPYFGTGIYASLRKLLWRSNTSDYPKWLNQNFANRFNLLERWQEFTSYQVVSFSAKMKAYQCLVSPLWATISEVYNPGCWWTPIEVRLPFLDLRLLNFLLALPPIPWCISKHILRLATEGYLPDEIRKRPKTLLMGNPFNKKLLHQEEIWKTLYQSTGIANYVDIDLVKKEAYSSENEWHPYECLRAISLNYWLMQ